MTNIKTIDWTLRIGLAFAFLYPAIDSFFNPGLWNGFFPPWLVALNPSSLETLGLAFAVFEIAVAAGVLFLPRPVVPATTALIILTAIVIFDFSAFDIVFRDVSIALMALALILIHKKAKLLPSNPTQ